MARLLTSFLVGIGYDTKGLEAGERQVNRSLGSVKSGALGISAALVGAFGAATASAVSTARRVDQLALATGNLRTSINFVNDYGNALRLLGGDAGDALTTISGIEDALNSLRLRGELGPFQDLALAGVDISALTGAESAEQFLRGLAAQLPELDKGQRALVQEALGLSDAVLKSLSGGVEELDSVMERANRLTGNVDQLTENSRRLAENAAEFSLILEGIANELAEKFLPSLIGVSSWINEFLNRNREAISAGLDVLSENAGATNVLAGSAALGVAGAAASKVGLRGVGAAAGRGGALGTIVAGSTLATDALFDWLEGFEAFKDVSDTVDRAARDVGLGRVVDFSDWLFGKERGADSVVAGQSMAVDPQFGRVIPAQNIDDLVLAIQAAKLKVRNDVNLTVQLDGQAIESKILDVTERAAFDTLDDITTTTER